MDIDHFLEKDIIEYLEKKSLEKQERRAEFDELESEKSFSPKKDYQFLLQQALDNDELVSAKNVFSEAQNQLKQATTEKDKQGYNDLVEDMYTKIQAHSRKEELIQAKEDLVSKESSIQKEKNNKDNLDKEQTKRAEEQTKKETSDLRKNKDSNRSIKNLDPLKKRILENSRMIGESLRNHDLLNAMKQYHDMRHNFSLIKESDEREEVFNVLITAYYQIKKAEQSVKAATIHKKKIEAEQKKQIIDDTKTKALMLSKKIQVFLKEEDYKKVIEEYNKLKDLFETIPKKYKEERKSMYNHILKVYNVIKKRVENQKDAVNNRGVKSGIKSNKSNNKLKSENQTTKQSVKQPVKLKLNPTNKPTTKPVTIDIKSKIKDVIMLMNNGKTHEAEIELLGIKQQVDNLTDKPSNKKKQFEEVIDEVNHRINFLKQTKSN